LRAQLAAFSAFHVKLKVRAIRNRRARAATWRRLVFSESQARVYIRRAGSNFAGRFASGRNTMSKERRLGRGLEALLGRPATEAPSSGAMGGSGATAVAEPPSKPALARHSESPAPAATSDGSGPLRIAEIERNPFQPRKAFDEHELSQLCDTIKAHGLIQPIVVRRLGAKYQLVAGERRLRACQKLGWTEIAAKVVTLDDRQMAEMAIIENLQRKDLGPLEKAAAFQAYLAQYKCPQDELAKRIGIDRSTIANLIRLLELPDEVQTAVQEEKISAGHARALLPLGEEKEQLAFCARIQVEGLSVRSTEQLVKETISAEDRGTKGNSGTVASPSSGSGPQVSLSKSDQVQSLIQTFRAALGAKVDLKQTAQDKGKIIIHFSSHEEFERIKLVLCGFHDPVAGAVQAPAADQPQPVAAAA